MTAIKTKGGPEMIAILRAFPTRIQNNALRGGLTAMARVVRDEAKLQVADTTATGKLRKAIKVGSPRVNQDGTVSVRLKIQGEHAYLARWMEYCVDRHMIARKGKDGKKRTALKIGDRFVSGVIEHPGLVAKPFFRVALDNRGKEAIDVLGQKIRSYLKDKGGFASPVTIESDDDEY